MQVKTKSSNRDTIPLSRLGSASSSRTAKRAEPRRQDNRVRKLGWSWLPVPVTPRRTANVSKMLVAFGQDVAHVLVHLPIAMHNHLVLCVRSEKQSQAPTDKPRKPSSKLQAPRSRRGHLFSVEIFAYRTNDRLIGVIIPGTDQGPPKSKAVLFVAPSRCDITVN